MLTAGALLTGAIVVAEGWCPWPYRPGHAGWLTESWRLRRGQGCHRVIFAQAGAIAIIGRWSATLIAARCRRKLVLATVSPQIRPSRGRSAANGRCRPRSLRPPRRRRPHRRRANNIATGSARVGRESDHERHQDQRHIGGAAEPADRPESPACRYRAADRRKCGRIRTVQGRSGVRGLRQRQLAETRSVRPARRRRAGSPGRAPETIVHRADRQQGDDQQHDGDSGADGEQHDAVAHARIVGDCKQQHHRDGGRESEMQPGAAREAQKQAAQQRDREARRPIRTPRVIKPTISSSSGKIRNGPKTFGSLKVALTRATCRAGM